MKKIISSLVVAMVLVLALSSTALAQSSVDGYSDQAGQIQSQVAGGGPGGGGGGGDSSLPFTGLDVALLAGAGGLLVAAGLGMRRLTRAPGSA
jgi:hypothetical protein